MTEFRYKGLSKEDLLDIQKPYKVSLTQGGIIPDISKIGEANDEFISEIRAEIKKVYMSYLEDLRLYTICELAIMYLDEKAAKRKMEDDGK